MHVLSRLFLPNYKECRLFPVGVLRPGASRVLMVNSALYSRPPGGRVQTDPATRQPSLIGPPACAIQLSRSHAKSRVDSQNSQPLGSWLVRVCPGPAASRSSSRCPAAWHVRASDRPPNSLTAVTAGRNNGPVLDLPLRLAYYVARSKRSKRLATAHELAEGPFPVDSLMNIVGLRLRCADGGR
jgi:hypothetical protein